jgi:phospholipase D1/2
MKLRTRSSAKVKDWVAAINAARRLPEGWCHPHRFGSFAPPRGLTEDGSTVQWFIDGQSAFDAIASSIEQAKSEVSFSSISLGFLQKIVLLACHVK